MLVALKEKAWDVNAAFAILWIRSQKIRLGHYDTKSDVFGVRLDFG